MKNKRYKEYSYEVGEIVNETLKIVEKIRFNNRKGYYVQSLKYPNAPYYKILESNLNRGDRDSYIYGSRVCDENSVWSLGELRKYIVDKNKAKKLRLNSKKKILLKCPLCSVERNVSGRSLNLYGFSCKVCSMNYSYPELFFAAYLETKKLNYDYQVKMKNSRRKIDFYLKDLNIFVETNGIIHYEKQYGSSWKDSYERTKESDKEKRKYAKKEGKKLIELDCRNSNFYFILNNINNTKELPNITNEDIPKIKKIIKDKNQKNTDDIIRMYSKGYSCEKIGRYFNVSETMVRNTLIRLGIKRRGINDTRKKRVLCINTGKVYESTYDAKDKTGVNQSNISNCCRGVVKSAGKHPVTGEKLRWEYV